MLKLKQKRAIWIDIDGGMGAENDFGFKFPPRLQGSVGASTLGYHGIPWGTLLGGAHGAPVPSPPPIGWRNKLSNTYGILVEVAKIQKLEYKLSQRDPN